ncbi:MAG: tetratricopeptide repeat protein [Lacunisphaera sp.]
MVITSIMRRFISPLFLAALSLLLFSPSRLAADLIWTPESGWHAQGGALAGIDGEDGRNALDLMNKARADEEANQEKAALSLYVKVGKKYPNSVFASEALFHIGMIRQKRRQYYKGFEAFQQMLSRYPNSEKFNQVIGEQYRIASDLFEGKRPRIWGVIPGFRNREKGIEYFETIVRTAPYSDYAPLSLINASKGYKQIGESEAAIDSLDRMINTYPRNVLTPDAYLKIAQTYASLVDGPAYDQASTKDAITYYEDYMILFPGDAGMVSAEKGLTKMKLTLAESKIVMADYYLKYRHNYKAAKVFYNEAITVYPDSDVAKKARAKLAVVDAKLEQQAALPPPKVKPTKPQKKKRLWIF